jgi:tRNA-dihydrouridine synthase A
MREPDLVARCVGAMLRAVKVPVTVKCRIGVDDQDSEESLFTLVDGCASAGARVFAVHARKAWLEGLSPKENRDIPPLDYDLVYRLKRERSELRIVLNGGVGSLDEALAHLDRVDGVMLGRLAYHEPAQLGEADHRLFDPNSTTIDAFAAVERHRPYLSARLSEGTPLAAMTRHMLGLMHGRPGARAWRRILTVEAIKPGAGLEVVDRALDEVRDAQARRTRAEAA